MASLQKDDDDLITGINITPFVDIVLVLLIIFMVTTSQIVRAQIDVDLPKAASGADQVQKTMVIQVDAQGAYSLNGDPSSLEAIGLFAKEAVRQDPEIRAVIAADKAVSYDHVMQAVDAIKVNGVSKFALNIERKNSQKS